MKIYALMLFSFLSVSHITGQCLEGDCKNGTGTYLYKSGAIFKGKFQSGQLSQGEYFYTNGDIYVGSYANGKKEGKDCKYYYSNGKYFIGTYHLGQKIEGKMLYNGGSWYDGEFQKGKRHGKGTFHFANGDEKSGYWKYGKYVGKNKVFCKNNIHFSILNVSDKVFMSFHQEFSILVC